MCNFQKVVDVVGSYGCCGLRLGKLVVGVFTCICFALVRKKAFFAKYIKVKPKPGLNKTRYGCGMGMAWQRFGCGIFTGRFFLYFSGVKYSLTAV